MKKYKTKNTRIKELVRKRGISQAILAEQVGMNTKFISDKVNMRGNLSLNNAMTIAKYLGCSIEDLYEWEEDKS